MVHMTSFAQGIHPFSMNPVEIPQGTGTGFVWDNKGHLVTNFHVGLFSARLVSSCITQFLQVVSKAGSKVQISLSDNTKFEASVRGTEPDKDLAVLKINSGSRDLPAIEVR